MSAGMPGHDPSRLEGPVYFAENGAQRVVYANLVMAEVTASPALAERLHVEPDTTLSLIERVTMLDGEVLAMRSAFTTIGLPELRGAGPALEGDFWDLLEVAGGQPLAESESSITVVQADASSAPHLGLDPGGLIVLVEALTLVVGGNPVALSFLRVPPANFNLTVRSSRS
jgi:DNA-binding GntR family transcriptional regulator